MLTAGRLGQRLYVAAEAMGLGCCGIGALYDSEAMEMLGLNQTSRLLYLVAVGNVKKTRVRQDVPRLYLPSGMITFICNRFP